MKVPCLPLSLVLLALQTSQSLNTNGHTGSVKIYSNLTQKRFKMLQSYLKTLY